MLPLSKRLTEWMRPPPKCWAPNFSHPTASWAVSGLQRHESRQKDGSIESHLIYENGKHFKMEIYSTQHSAVWNDLLQLERQKLFVLKPISHMYHFAILWVFCEIVVFPIPKILSCDFRIIQNQMQMQSKMLDLESMPSHLSEFQNYKLWNSAFIAQRCPNSKWFAKSFGVLCINITNVGSWKDVTMCFNIVSF